MMWSAWFRKRKWERSLDTELRFHIDQLTRDLTAGGMSPAEARRQALSEFGSVELAKDECRDQRPLLWLADAVADTRFALRTFVRTPGFTLVAILTLALGIGANTAMFTLVHRVLLQTLPVSHPEELVELGCVDPNRPDRVGCRSSYPGYELFQRNQQTLSGLFGFATTGDLLIAHASGTELMKGMLATGGMHQTLGVSPEIGRLLQPSDDEPGAPPVAVLSHSYWQRQFGGDPQVVGKTLRVNTHSVTIVGVTPANFRGVTLGENSSITIAVGSGANLFHGANSLQNSSNQWLRIMGRRKSGITNAQVQTALQPVFQQGIEQLLASIPAGAQSRGREYFSHVRFQVQPADVGGASEFRRDLDRPLRILMAVVGVVLLMACVNLASLVLSRMAGRQRELGIRMAIGAGSGRLVRQLLAETLLLSIAGAAVGTLVAQAASPFLLRLAAGDVSLQAVDLSPDPTVLAFTAGMAILTGLLLSAGPILRLRKGDPQKAIRAGKPGRFLIPVQVALATVTLIGAGLLLQTFANFARTPLGFQSENRVTFLLAPRLAGYDADRSKDYFAELARRLEAVPGVLASSVSTEAMGGLGSMTLIDVPGYVSATSVDHAVGVNHVGSRFIETNGLKLLQGRDLEPADQQNTRRSAVVNEAFARHFFGHSDVLHRQLNFTGETNAPFEIVGLVADARDRGPKTLPQPVVYLPYGRQHFDRGVVTLHVTNTGAALTESIRGVIRDLDSRIPIQDFRTLSSRLEDSLRRERLLALLGTFFGFLVLLLVSIGIYGTISGTVTQRTGEIGIRIALGARRSSVLWMFLGKGLGLVGIGLLIGTGAGALVTGLLRSQLYGVQPHDPGTFAIAGAVLVTAACSALLIPALRASRLEPLSALRRD